MSDTETRKIVRRIRELESSFCNPLKLQMAGELREYLMENGLTKREIDRMVDDE